MFQEDTSWMEVPPALPRNSPPPLNLHVQLVVTIAVFEGTASNYLKGCGCLCSVLVGWGQYVLDGLHWEIFLQKFGRGGWVVANMFRSTFSEIVGTHIR